MAVVKSNRNKNRNEVIKSINICKTLKLVAKPNTFLKTCRSLCIHNRMRIMYTNHIEDAQHNKYDVYKIVASKLNL